MRKLIIIAVAAAIVAILGHSVIRSEHVLPTAADKGFVPSPLQMMTDAEDLPATPFVAP